MQTFAATSAVRKRISLRSARSRHTSRAHKSRQTRRWAAALHRNPTGCSPILGRRHHSTTSCRSRKAVRTAERATRPEDVVPVPPGAYLGFVNVVRMPPESRARRPRCARSARRRQRSRESTMRGRPRVFSSSFARARSLASNVSKSAADLPELRPQDFGACKLIRSRAALPGKDRAIQEVGVLTQALFAGDGAALLVATTCLRIASAFISICSSCFRNGSFPGSAAACASRAWRTLLIRWTSVDI